MDSDSEYTGEAPAEDFSIGEQVFVVCGTCRTGHGTCPAYTDYDHRELIVRGHCKSTGKTFLLFEEMLGGCSAHIYFKSMRQSGHEYEYYGQR